MFIVWSRQLCKPQWQADGAILLLCGLSHKLKHLANGNIVAGQNVSLTGFSVLGTVENAFCHIPYIHEVISAANGKGQLSAKKRFRH